MLSKETRYRIKVFLCSFFISLIVFGGMFAGVYYLVLMRSEAVENESVTVPIQERYLPKPQDNLSVTMIGCPERNQPPQFFLLIKFDVVRAVCNVVSIPAETLVTYQGKTRTMIQHYTYGGMEGCSAAIQEAFSLSSDYYIRVDPAGVKEFVDFFSGVTYSMPQKLVTEDYRFSEGKQLLDGSRVASLLFSQKFTQNAQLVSQLLLNALNDRLSNRLDSFYDLIFEKTDTNLNRVIFNDLDKPVHYFLRNNEKRFLPAQLIGTMNQEGLLPDPDALAKIRSQLSDEKIA